MMDFNRLLDDHQHLTAEELVERVTSGRASCAEVTQYLLQYVSIAMEATSKASKELKKGSDRHLALQYLHLANDSRRFLIGISPTLNYYPEHKEILESTIETVFHATGQLAPLITYMESEEADKEVFTYIVRNKLTDYVKIGRSQDVQRRVKTLECGAGTRLEIIATIRGDVEGELHRRFAEYLHHSEWFDDRDGKIMEYARSI